MMCLVSGLRMACVVPGVAWPPQSIHRIGATPDREVNWSRGDGPAGCVAVVHRNNDWQQKFPQKICNILNLAHNDRVLPDTGNIFLR